MSTGQISRKKMPSRLSVETRSKSRLTRINRKEVNSDSDSDSLEAEMRALGVHMKQYAERTACTSSRDKLREVLQSKQATDGESSVDGTCYWCFKLGPKLFTQKNPSTDETSIFCSEQCFSQWRRATFKKGKICDWCKHVRNTVNYADQLDGDQALQFCSDKCLNQYKMSVFCKETQAHLQLLQNANGADFKTRSSASLANGSNKAAGVETGLITPDLWMRHCKDPTPDDKDDEESDDQVVKVKQEIEDSEGEKEEVVLPRRHEVRENEPTCKMTKMLLKHADLPLKLRPDLKKHPTRHPQKHKKETKSGKAEKAPVPPLYPIIPGMGPNFGALLHQSMQVQHSMPWMPPYLVPQLRPIEEMYQPHQEPSPTPPMESCQREEVSPRSGEKRRTPPLPEPLPSGLTIERVEKQSKLELPNESEPNSSHNVPQLSPQQVKQDVPTSTTLQPEPPRAPEGSTSLADYFKSLLPYSTILVPTPVIVPIPIPIPIPIPFNLFPQQDTKLTPGLSTSRREPKSAENSDGETLDLSTKKHDGKEGRS